MHFVDKTLSCARAERDRRDNAQGILETSRSFRLVSVDSLRGRLHIVPANFGISLLHDNVLQKNEVDDFSDKFIDWKNDVFSLNRFFRHKEGTYQFINDDAKKSF